jgi:N-dimethylarginine dimethylaminohydrolase
MALSYAPRRDLGVARSPVPRRYLMCPPWHFEVAYSINPWMHPGGPVDRDLAVRQWEALVATYEALGHTVELIDPVLGLPDMVFAANSGTVIDGRVLTARFRHDERAGEEEPYRRWFHEAGYEVRAASRRNEGEGDFAVVGDVVLAASGFRSEPAAHAEAASFFGRDVVSLELVDPRFYHLDTALAVLADDHVAYYPPAFSAASRARLEASFRDAVIAAERDALVLGLNATSDGRRVVLPAQAEGLARALEAEGYEPIGVDLSELLKAGGSVKCCTLELRDPTE